MFTIETKSAATGNAWTTEGLGDAAEFESEELAEETIDDLRGLGPDWSEAEYRVVEREYRVVERELRHRWADARLTTPEPW